MRIGSLFSGYGGLDLALGGTVAWHAEIDKHPAAILAHHHPDVPNLGDITAVDWKGMAMAANRKLSPDQVASAVDMYEMGMALAPIAEYFGVSRQAMWDLLRRRTTMRPQKRYGAANHFWRVDCPDCGREFYVNGLPRHRASCKKRRGAA